MERDNIYLFKPCTLNGRTVRNRLAAQAMEINSAGEAGCVSNEIISRYRELAKGGWGIVFVEAISVRQDSLARRNGLLISGRNLDGFKRLVDEFRKIDPQCLLMFQLSHAGRYAGEFSRKVKVFGEDCPEIHLLNTSELDGIRDAFIEAALLSHKAGADGVDIKACHGYLGGELLRPANTRADKYGGSDENRSRLLREAIGEIKKIYPGLITGTRISLYEGIRGGCGTLKKDELIEDLGSMLGMTRLIVGSGADFINVSAGIPAVTPGLTRPGADGSFSMFHHFRYAKTVKEAFKETTVIGSAYSAGSKDSAAFAEENIEKGYADFAGYGRQNLADPLFPLKLSRSRETINWCRLCGGCSKLLKAQKAVFCTAYKNK